ncbi:MAG: CZB domain-containing protein [Candidatus Omnitrophota bacterium]
MLNMEGMDLHRAGIEHLLWKRSIRNYLDDKEGKDTMETVSHKNCRVGQWIYSSGKKNYGEMTELRELEIVHVETHNIANRIIRLKKDGNNLEAETEYEKLETISKVIVSKLTALAIRLSD